jgi:D-alanyl-D-alanine carboxypeptidase (penicillin-binding protein 5/6)
MALIARSYIQNFPEALQFHSMQEYTYGDIRQYNRNGLLRRDPTVDGLKTGYTVKSGYHLLATAKRGKRRLIAVVMGAKTRAIREREAQKLLNYGYQNFELLPLFTDGQVLAEIPVWKGAKDTVSLVTAGSGVMTVPVEYKKDIREEREVPNQVIAPIEQGQVIGKVIIKLKAEIIKSVSLVAQHKVGKAGLVKSFSHSMYLLGKSHAGLFVVFLLIMMSVPIGYFFFATRRRKRRRSGFRF